MQMVMEVNENISDKTGLETLLSYLDKGIDDVEADRLHTVDEAFQMIRDRMEHEL